MQQGGSGDVGGSALVVAGNIAVFGDATGKIIADSGFPAKTALQQNLIVNPAMQVSQENDVTASGAKGYYAAGQWVGAYVTTGAISFERVASRTPRNSKYRLHLTVTTADTSIAPGEILHIQHPLGGNRVANLGWNGANGTPLVLRFGFRGPAGTYSMAYQNGAGLQSFVSNVTISAGQVNTDIEITKIVPPV